MKAFICCLAQTWKRRTLIRIGFSIASEVTPPRHDDDDDDDDDDVDDDDDDHDDDDDDGEL